MGIKQVHIKYLSLILTILAFFLSFPIFFGIVWLVYIGHYDCEDLLELPNLQTEIIVGLVFLFFITNIVVIYLRSRYSVIGFLVIVILLILSLILGLGLVGAFKTSTFGSPLWIKMNVINKSHWGNIKSCIYDTKICDDMATRADELVATGFPSNEISPTELGCCKPPSSCGMEHVNGTWWKRGSVEADPNKYDTDCDLWNNDDTILCYSCYSCKHGFTKQLQRKWLKLGVSLLVLTVLLSIAHVALFFVSMLEHYIKE